MKRRFDTLFVRLALTSLAVVLLVQAGSMAIMIVQRPRHDIEGYARGVLLVLETAHMHEPGTSGSGVLWAGIPIQVIPDFDRPLGMHSRFGSEPSRFSRASGGHITVGHPVAPLIGAAGFREQPPVGIPSDASPATELDSLQQDDGDTTVSAEPAAGLTESEEYASGTMPRHRPKRVRYVEVSASEARAVRSSPNAFYSGLVHALKTRLPSGTEIRFDKAQPINLWARFPGSARWIVTPIDPPPTPPFLIEFGAMTLVDRACAARRMATPVAGRARRAGCARIRAGAPSAAGRTQRAARTA
jgi:hypothetical protein